MFFLCPISNLNEFLIYDLWKVFKLKQQKSHYPPNPNISMKMKAKNKNDIDTLLKRKQHKDKRPINELEPKYTFTNSDMKKKMII